jgi:arylsulfatase
MGELVEYPHGAAFPGVIGRTIQESSPAWPQPTRAREGSPNVLGRVIDAVQEIGELDNTLVMLISDNGASSEGGVSGAFNEMSSFNNRWETVDEVLPRIDELGGTRAYNHYPWGWSWAGNTP